LNVIEVSEFHEIASWTFCSWIDLKPANGSTQLSGRGEIIRPSRTSAVAGLSIARSASAGIGSQLGLRVQV
jgi:hypothetical protein